MIGPAQFSPFEGAASGARDRMVAVDQQLGASSTKTEPLLTLLSGFWNLKAQSQQQDKAGYFSHDRVLENWCLPPK